jgi:hypothetical protein
MAIPFRVGKNIDAGWKALMELGLINEQLKIKMFATVSRSLCDSF